MPTDNPQIPGNRNPSSGKTVNTAVRDAAARFPDRPALSYKAGQAYQSITYSDLLYRVSELASGLSALGVKNGDRIAILAESGPNWVEADLAILSLGAISVPIYPTLPANQVSYILRDAGVVAICTGDMAQSTKVCEQRKSLPALTDVIQMLEVGGPDVRTLDQLRTLGREQPLSEESYRQAWSTPQPDDLASIIYTSGTTGDPKGVELTHWNFVSVVNAARDLMIWDENSVFLSLLPLAHIYERTCGYYMPLSLGANISFMESLGRLLVNFQEVRPTHMFAVPRVWEMLKGRIEDTVSKSSPSKQRLFAWALRVGERVAYRSMRGLSPDPYTAAQYAMADRLVFQSIRERFGGRLQWCVSGGASLPADAMMFFHAIGMPILEGYGLTETTSLLTVGRPGAVRAGTVGLVSYGSEVILDEDNEILCRGGGVARGYWNKPEETRNAMTENGWFRTGDLGAWVEDRFLVITGRKKDILVLSNGKNVAPQSIEERLKASPYITDVAVMGDGAPAVVALVVPAFERLQTEFQAPQDRKALISDPAVRKIIKKEIDRLSEGLADFERVRRFALLEREFSIENGELTPTLKVKRYVLAQEYYDVLARLNA